MPAIAVNVPAFAEVETMVNAALADFHAREQYLLDNDLNERTISHRLAIHLQYRFHEWDVDCEYNRHLDATKILDLPRDGISWDDTQGKTVFPDIIVHKRGLGPNLLVIEMKKSGPSANFDYQKLTAYKSQIGYTYACFLRVRIGPGGRVEAPEWH